MIVQTDLCLKNHDNLQLLKPNSVFIQPDSKLSICFTSGLLRCATKNNVKLQFEWLKRGEEMCCNLFHKANCGLWLVKDYFLNSLSLLLPPLPLKPDPWMARKALTSATAWCRGGTVVPCACVHQLVWRAETPDMFWKCAVDKGKTGRDLLEEVCRPSGYQSTVFVPPLKQPLQTFARIRSTPSWFYSSFI